MNSTLLVVIYSLIGIVISIVANLFVEFEDNDPLDAFLSAIIILFWLPILIFAIMVGAFCSIGLIPKLLIKVAELVLERINKD